jgi:hypothetical protein
MKLLTLVATACTVAQFSSAADCRGKKQKTGDFEHIWWELRQQMCNNEKCAYQKPCTTNFRFFNAYGASVNFWVDRANVQGAKPGFPSCWVSQH